MPQAVAEGWQIADLQVHGPYAVPISYYPLDHFSSGGNSGGFVQGLDPSSYTFSFCMPEYAFECVETFLGGNISFDMRSTANNWTVESFLILVCDTEVLISEFSLPTTAWQSYSIDFIRKLLGSTKDNHRKS